MEEDILLLIMVVFCLLFMIITQVVFWMHRIMARKNIIAHWLKFLEAEKSNDINLLNLYGDKLIWNRYISQDQIDELNNSLLFRLKDHPVLKSLYDVSKNRRSYLSDDDRLRIYGN